MKLPKSKLPREFVTGLFNPQFMPQDPDLNDLVREGVQIERTEAAATVIQNRIADPTPKTSSGVPVPVTEAQAEEADRQILNTQLRIQAAKQKLLATRATVDEAIRSSTGGKELSFKVDISRKPHVKKALRRLTGQKLDTITYSMYVEMLKAKSELEKKEVDEYSKGHTK